MLSKEIKEHVTGKKPWNTPRIDVLFVSETKNTPVCGTVDSPCTKESSFGPEDCGTC
ncbi:MAG: hypothetical protein HQM10_26885 [Candidatus Riflebacteria bacterium]|nr:hypothetical protein [Candidatus Riflebacteria bacterium]